MYHLRLRKARSYVGIVQATQKRPDVYVPEKEQAESLVNSGYFELVEEDAAGTADDSADSGESEADLFEEEAEDEPQENPAIAEVQKMTKAQLTDYAGKNGIDITGCKDKGEILAKVVAAINNADAARAALREE